jgi:O-antigen/teichoic acid export membrane protein
VLIPNSLYLDYPQIQWRGLNTSTRTILSNTAANIALRGATTGTRLIVLFIVAKILSPESFGVISASLAIIDIAKVVADFGIDAYGMRLLATQPSRAGFTLGDMRLAKLICGAAAYVVALGLLWVSNGAAQIAIDAPLALLIAATLLSNLAIDYFQSRLEVREIVAPVIGISLCTITAAVALSFFVTSAWLVLLLPLSESLIAFVLYRRLKRAVRPIQQSNLSNALKLMSYSLPLAITVIIVAIYSRIGILALKQYSGDAAAGYFGVASRFTDPFQLIAASFATSLYSHLSAALTHKNKTDARAITQKYLLGVLAYGVVCALLIIFVSPVLVNRFLPQYTPALPIMRVMGGLVIAQSLNQCLTAIIQAHGHFKWMTALSVWNLIAIVTLVALLLPVNGALGVATALLIAEALNAVIQFALSRKALRTETSSS